MHTRTHSRFPSLEVDIEAELEVLAGYAARLRPLVCDTVLYVNTAVKEKKKVVVEGANAAMLDIDFGEEGLGGHVESKSVTIVVVVVVVVDTLL